MKSHVAVLVGTLAVVGLQCSPPMAPQTNAKRPIQLPRSAVETDEPVVGPSARAAPSGTEWPDPPARKAGPRALLVAPAASEEARAAGVSLLTHVPYQFPESKVQARVACSPVDGSLVCARTEPHVVPVALPFPEPVPNERGRISIGYGMQATVTRSGVLEMEHGLVDLGPWMQAAPNGEAILTPPAEWEGLVHLGEGSSLIGYGHQALINYREYVRRYLPWRAQEEATVARLLSSRYARAEMLLGSLITGDVDADGTPELVAYVFVEWYDTLGAPAGVQGELGVIWKDPKKEPATLIFISMPGELPLPRVVPPRLNGGRARLFSVHYCCAGTDLDWANLAPGVVALGTQSAEDGEWHIYLEPAEAGDAALYIGAGDRVDWDAIGQ